MTYRVDLCVCCTCGCLIITEERGYEEEDVVSVFHG